ncbi:MAG TPA: 50S ribosomal protein L32 [Candidatus Dojkabacteria bacterium]|jgi:large subunit ribosomal protein L32
MGALPKRKISKQRKNNRRSHHHMGNGKPTLVKDPKTGKLLPPHTINPITGEYRGRKILKVE